LSAKTKSALQKQDNVDIENKLKCIQNFRIETLDSTLKIVAGVFDDASPLERVLHILAERHAIHDEGLELVNEVLPSRLLSRMPLQGLTLEVDRS
jgi:hypothetical protein